MNGLLEKIGSHQPGSASQEPLQRSALRTSVEDLYAHAADRDSTERQLANVLGLEHNHFAGNEDLHHFGASLALAYQEEPDDPQSIVTGLVELLAERDFATLLAFLEFQGIEPLPEALRPRGDDEGTKVFLNNLLNFVLSQGFQQERAELVRRALKLREQYQRKNILEVFDNIRDSVGIAGLKAGLARLANIPTTAHDKFQLREIFDLHTSSNPENTRLHRALSAVLSLLDAERAKDADEQKVALDALREETVRFVAGILNAGDSARVVNLTDTYGAEPNVPAAENDLTRLRFQEYQEQLGRDYGVRDLRVVEQGTSIDCPEQCGAFAAIALAQAAARRGRNIDGRGEVFLLNNAARVSDQDGNSGGEEATEQAGSSALLCVKFQIDGIEHTAFAYGHDTLTPLRPFITDVWEFPGTENGSQFRSMEYALHYSLNSALADGALPAAYKAKQIGVEIVPEPKLGENQFQYLGCDKYGNGLLNIPAEELFEKYLPSGQEQGVVNVRILDREGVEIVGSKEYVLGRYLGEVRGGQKAIWASSSRNASDSHNYLRNYANIGVFKAQRDDINEDIVNEACPGCIIEITKIS